MIIAIGLYQGFTAANDCPVHGGAAPQVKAAAKRRLDQAADVLVQRPLKFALDGDAPDHVALAAIRDALDRAGMGANKPWVSKSQSSHGKNCLAT